MRLLVREQRLLTGVLDEIRRLLLPFALLGLDTDNDSAFVDETELAARPRYHVHHTATFASWLNQVERRFALLTQR